MVYNASDAIALTIHDTGLDEGDSIAIESLDSDAIDVELDAGSNGTLTVELPSGDHRLLLSTASSGGGFPGLPPPPPPAEPASFEFGEATLPATSLGVGETLSVEVTVTNVGDETGTTTVSLLVDGDPVDEVDVTLAGGVEETVALTHAFDAEGEFGVEIPDVLAESVSVVDPDPPDDSSDETDDSGSDSAPEEPAVDESSDGDGGMVGYGLVVGLLALGATVAFAIRRQTGT